MNHAQRIFEKAQKNSEYIQTRQLIKGVCIPARNWGKGFTNIFKLAVEYTLENLWIEVSEELPEKTGFKERSALVLFRAKDPDRTDVGYYFHDSKKWVSHGYPVKNVVWWMPINIPDTLPF